MKKTNVSFVGLLSAFLATIFIELAAIEQYLSGIRHLENSVLFYLPVHVNTQIVLVSLACCFQLSSFILLRIYWKQHPTGSGKEEKELEKMIEVVNNFSATSLGKIKRPSERGNFFIY